MQGKRKKQDNERKEKDFLLPYLLETKDVWSLVGNITKRKKPSGNFRNSIVDIQDCLLFYLPEKCFTCFNLRHFNNTLNYNDYVSET